jgi:hypothetical protein
MVLARARRVRAPGVRRTGGMPGAGQFLGPAASGGVTITVRQAAPRAVAKTARPAVPSARYTSS